MNNSTLHIDHGALQQLLAAQGSAFVDSLTERHAHLFADVPVVISASALAQMREVIAAIEQVVDNPAWINSNDYLKCKGVFFGYDFHINSEGAHLIEINTNAGGAFLNAILLQSQLGAKLPGDGISSEALRPEIIEMFRNEWRLEHGDLPLKTIAIIDEAPLTQYLYPEFILAQRWFEQAGIHALIADARELDAREDGIYLGSQKIDLIYNRLTDFSLESYPALLQASTGKQVVVTPHPFVYKQYSDKRNLVRLTDGDYLHSIGVPDATIDILLQGIPKTTLISAAEADNWWLARKHWFFKPVSGYGAKGAYRGDKLTKRVFEEILAGDYVAQKLAAPGECVVVQDESAITLKYDVRCYVYDGKIQLIAARLYQGQTTNFRTAGGGFGVVRITQ
ncbi:MAG: hypothetical protein WC742_10200 [Gallionellaceae bacterium]|jgi:hypothetical protein